MDKQTAIDLLDNLLGMVEDNHESDYDAALHMGIDALKSNAPNALSALDCVERQAVIDALDALCDRECEYSKQQRRVMCGACRLGSAFDVIDDLPSAQPNLQQTCNKLATDCISRKAAIDAVNGLPDCPNGFSGTYDKAAIIGILEDVPSVQPEKMQSSEEDATIWLNGFIIGAYIRGME